MSMTWALNKWIAFRALHQRTAFILFFLIAYNATPTEKIITLWFCAVASGISAAVSLYGWFVKKQKWGEIEAPNKRYGTMGNWNKGASVFLPGFFIAVHLAVTTGPYAGKAAAIICALLSLGCILHAKTKSAFMGVVIGCLYLIIYVIV
jgi:hypothetical protein